jgi:hypothetical protein
MLERYAADMKELIGTASKEDSGKGPGDFSKQLQERQPDVVLLSDPSETQCGLNIVNNHFYRNDFLRKAALPLKVQKPFIPHNHQHHYHPSLVYIKRTVV